VRHVIIIAFVENPAYSPRLQAFAADAVAQGAYLIGADSGGEVALAWGLKPQLALGDFDSISPVALERLKTLPGVEVRVASVHKDETDLELALLAAYEAGCRDITIVGGLGGRLDHTLGNLYLLADPRLHDARLSLLGENERVYFLRGGQTLTLHGEPGEQVSLIPVSPVAAGVRTAGLYYPLNSEPLYIGPSRGISNQFVGTEASVSFDDGLLLVIHNFAH
jgi:thiamine pyrophosphokinase